MVELTNESSNETKQSLFQAVGIIKGEVNFGENGDQPSIIIENNSYRLITIPTAQGHRAIGALKGQVANHGKLQKLLVYPRVLHVPEKEITHKIAFSVVGFWNPEKDVKNTLWELEENEFILAGLWQKIPVCRYPVLTVFKNLTDDRIKFVSKASPIVRAGFMKPNHIPFKYDNPIVPPFYFSKHKAVNEQEIKYFLEVKAIFNPNQNVFVFDSLEALPKEEPPKHLHVSKKDKQQAIVDKRKRKAENVRNANDQFKSNLFKGKSTNENKKSVPLPIKRNPTKTSNFVPPVIKKK